MIVPARPEKAPITSSRRSWQRCSLLKALCQALDGPALPGLDGCLLAFMGDLPGHAASGQLVAGFLRVVPGVQVHPHVTGHRAELAELVQRGRQQQGVVPVRRGQHPVQRNAVAVGHAGALHALLAPVDRAAAGALAAPGRHTNTREL